MFSLGAVKENYWLLQEERCSKKNIVETQEKYLRDEKKPHKFQIGSSCVFFHTAKSNILNIWLFEVMKLMVLIRNLVFISSAEFFFGPIKNY